MKTKLQGKKSFIGFFKQINTISKKKRSLSNPRSDRRIFEQLNFDNVAYLSDN